MRAQKLWFAILESQIETGTPYMLYKDSCNRKSNQQVREKRYVYMCKKESGILPHTHTRVYMYVTANLHCTCIKCNMYIFLSYYSLLHVSIICTCTYMYRCISFSKCTCTSRLFYLSLYRTLVLFRAVICVLKLLNTLVTMR